MKNETHTPGEWAVSLDNPTKVIGISMGRTFHRLIATAHDAGGGVSEKKANARLIAAAPELLAALERCLNQLDAFAGCTTPEQTGFEDVRKTASYISSRAALAKAKGAV